jgi:hypothetical protein
MYLSDNLSGELMKFLSYFYILTIFMSTQLVSCQSSNDSDSSKIDVATINDANNIVPAITFNSPDRSITIPLESKLEVSWYARDLDSNAKINLYVVSSSIINPIAACPANSCKKLNNSLMYEDSDTQFTINTIDGWFASKSTFQVALIIDDEINDPVRVYSPVITISLLSVAPKITYPDSTLPTTTLQRFNGIRIKWSDFNAYPGHEITLKSSVNATEAGCNAGTAVTLASAIPDNDKKNYFEFVPGNFPTVTNGIKYICLIYRSTDPNILGKTYYSFSGPISIVAANYAITAQTNFDGSQTPTPAPVVHAGAVGNSTFWGGGGNNSSLTLTSAMALPTTSFTLEFAIKLPTPDTQFQGMDGVALNRDQYVLFNSPVFNLSLSPSMGWLGTFQTLNGQQNFNIWLDGINENSFSYLANGSWHHVAISWDGGTGDVKLYVDGKLPAGFNQKIEPGNLSAWTGNFFLGEKFVGEIDQIALTNRILPHTNIARHSQNLLAGQSYATTDLIPVPTPAAILYADLPAIYLEATVDPTNSLTSLTSFPVPNFKGSNSLQRNRLAVRGRFLAQSGSVESESILNQREADIQLELAKFYNYSFLISEGQYPTILAAQDKVVEMANAWTGIPAGIWSGYEELPDNFINNVSLLPNTLRLTNMADKMIGCDGLVGGRCPIPFPPLGFYAEDAYNKGDLLNPFLVELTGRTIDYIQDGKDFLNWDISGYANNQRAKNLRLEMNLDWNSFQTKNLARLYSSYVFELANYDQGLTSFANAPYLMMDIAGKNSRNRSYDLMKNINQDILGQQYPTPLFTPLSPRAWKLSQTGSYGLAWIWESRRIEETLFFAPFVSAFQDSDTASSAPPFHFLANLKMMGVWGANFFNVAMDFILNENTDARKPMWAFATAGLAQGALSHAEDVLLNGDFLIYESVQKDFTLISGGMDVPIAIRKHNMSEKYLIGVTRMPTSFRNGAIPTSKNVTIVLSGKTLTLEGRPQGSLYYFDNTGVAPVLYQLDKFHEDKHPQRWSKVSFLEAEMFDSLGTNTALQETLLIAPPALASTDNTYLNNISANSEVTYNLTPHIAGDHQVQGIIATSIATTFTIELYDPDVSFIVPIQTLTPSVNNGSLSSSTLGTFTSLARKNYVIKIQVDQVGTQWDSFMLTPL